MATRITSVQDGPRMTVSTMMKSPTFLPRRVLNMMDNEFLVNALLRKGNDTPSGAVVYYESTPLYAEDDPQVMDEFTEIPVTNGSVGIPRVVRSVRRALGLRVSKQMIDRNNADAVTIQMTQIRNTMVRSWEDALFSAMLANANIQTLVTDQPWGSSTSHIRRDINAAKYVIKNAAADSAGKQKFGYVADTLVISTETEEDFLSSDDVAKPYVGNIASENLQYTGKLPNKFLGLDVLTSWRLSVYAPNSAIVMQRNIAGAISDERPLEATPMYGEGNGPNGGPREAWRSDITRASAISLDQPKAICLITGVTQGETFPAGTGDTIS